jgi:16S rRNA (guanine966-N2)-methyltransferase
MMDRVREALFSALGDAVVDVEVLDLYAGSGSLGLEALSRGAAGATFVERGRAALASLRANITAVGLGGRVVAGDVASFLVDDRGRYGLAFVDPPYALSLPSVTTVLGLLAPRLCGGAVVVLHRRAGEAVPEVQGLEEVDRRSYGDAELTRFVKEDEA